jgi:hypothetical protein
MGAECAGRTFHHAGHGEPRRVAEDRLDGGVRV